MDYHKNTSVGRLFHYCGVFVPHIWSDCPTDVKRLVDAKKNSS